MKDKFVVSMVVLSIALPSLLCYGAPYNYNANYSNNNRAPAPAPRQEEVSSSTRALADLKYEMKNHETELKNIEGQLQNQESIIDALRHQVNETLQDQKDQSRAQTVNLEAKFETLQNTVKGLIEDMRQIKNQANDSVTILGQYKQKLSEFERLMDAQNQHMKNLEAGLSSLVEVMQAKDASDRVLTRISNSESTGSQTYKVQSGDRLEKIARANKVSIQALRDCNGLKDDKIFVGQTLKIPN